MSDSTSAAPLKRPPMFREEQAFRMRRVRLLLAVPPAAVSALAVWQVGLGHTWGRYPMSNGGLLFLAILLWAVYWWLARIRLVTTVEAGTVVVRLAGMGRTDRIDLAQVRTAAVTSFDAAREFGGYGWRTFKGGRAYLANNTTGVRLQTQSGSTIVIGSDRPPELLLAIEAARRR